MLSDTPPERDSEWTQSGIEGAWRFVSARLASGAGGHRAGRAEGRGQSPRASMPPRPRCAAPPIGLAHQVADDVERLRFNVAVAHVHEFANAFGQAIASARTASPVPADLAFALREAAEIVTRVVGPMVPHLAEECWARSAMTPCSPRRRGPRRSRSCWWRTPSRCRSRSTARSATTSPCRATRPAAEVEAAVLEMESVRRALDGKAPKRIIVVPQRIVNVVA